MRRSSLVTAIFGSVAVAVFVCTTAFAQSAASPSQVQSGNWGIMPGPPVMPGSPVLPGAPPIMPGPPPMMGGYPMMAMPMYPCGAMGPGMMTGGAQDPKTAAKMMEMHAEMMRANAAIMEKYAKELESTK